MMSELTPDPSCPASVLPLDERSLPQLRTQELIQRAHAGNETAWAEIYTRYRRSLEPIVRAKLVSCPSARVDPDDVLQSAFVLAWQRLSKFEYQGEGSLLRWITVVTLNKLTDQLRARPTDEGHHATDYESATHDGADPRTSPDLAAEAAEYRLRLLDCISKLDEQEQEVLAARLIEELPWPEITARLGTPESTLRNRLQAAVRKLSHRLAHWEPK